MWQQKAFLFLSKCYGNSGGDDILVIFPSFDRVPAITVVPVSVWVLSAGYKVIFFLFFILLLLTANGFSPGGSGTTIRQQTKYKLTTIRQHKYKHKTTDNNTRQQTIINTFNNKLTLQIQLTNTVNTNNHNKYKHCVCCLRPQDPKVCWQNAWKYCDIQTWVGGSKI
jgi:hypothetical protein